MEYTEATPTEYIIYEVNSLIIEKLLTDYLLRY